MRNQALELLDGLVGTWKVTLSDAWFIEPPGTEVQGTATVQWIGEAFIVVRAELDGEMDLALGRSDAREAYIALYHDDRGVCRIFDMEFDGTNWTMLREDPDFHQRWIAVVEPDRIAGRWEASEDQGRTWKKDFDLTFVRG
jgi:hypothetical protein